MVEELIAARNPCAGLVTEIAGQRVGIDKLDAVALRTANASLRDDVVTLSLSGRLACKTSDAALVSGDASAAVAAEASVSLADCDAATLDVRLRDFGGSFAGVAGIATGPRTPDRAVGSPRSGQGLSQTARRG